MMCPDCEGKKRLPSQRYRAVVALIHAHEGGK